MDEAGSRTIAFSIQGSIARSDLDGLSALVCALLEGSGDRLALCDVRDLVPDAVTIEALARFQLEARRRGCRVKLLQHTEVSQAHGGTRLAGPLTRGTKGAWAHGHLGFLTS